VAAALGPRANADRGHRELFSDYLRHARGHQLQEDSKDPGILQLKGYVLGMRWLGRESSWVREEKLRE